MNIMSYNEYNNIIPIVCIDTSSPVRSAGVPAPTGLDTLLGGSVCDDVEVRVKVHINYPFTLTLKC